MLLIFPSIEIRKGECVQLVHGEPGAERSYSVDPVQMAILWRGENAKTLHVVDLEGVESGKVQNRDVIRRMCQAVDIPIQLGGGLRDEDEITSAFELGIYRVVIGTAAVTNPGLVERLIKRLGARKFAVAIEARENKIRVEGGRLEIDLDPVKFALEMNKLGVCRFVYAGIGEDGRSKILDFEALKRLALQTGVRVTAQGGVNGYQDLIKLQELEKYGVDSVIIGKALYDNQFPCQRLWRINEQALTDLGPTRRP